MTDERVRTGDEEPEEGDKLPFMAHLEELRSRLIRCLLAGIVGFFVCYAVSDRIFLFIIGPLREALPPGNQPAVLKLTEGFVTYMKLSAVGGVILASHVILYQIWKFVAPGLYAHEKRYVWPFVFAATFFFLLGASFAFWVVFPFAFKFLLGYAVGPIRATISVGFYLDFALKLLLSFGLIFEMPVAAFFVGKMGLLSYRPLSQNRGYAVIGIAIIAAILTPTPDVFNQALMGVPLYILFEISIVVLKIFGPKPEPETKEEEEELEEETPNPPAVTE